MPLVFILTLCLYLGGNFYVFYRGWQAISFLPLSIKIGIGIIYWICALCFLGMFLFRNIALPTSIGHVLYEVGTGWMVFILYMIIGVILIDLLKLFNIYFTHSFFILLAAVGGLLGYGYYQYIHPKTEVINIDINNSSTSFQQLKVVGISDIHLGYGTTKQTLRKYVDMINKEKPDLILISGDLIDNSIIPLETQRMEEELSELKAPLGIYMVPGNHEYISGIEESIHFIEKTQIQLLMDSVVTLPNGLQIVGRDDRFNSSRLSLRELSRKTNPKLPSILLDHQPYALEETEREGFDIQFSGHTHRGQVWPINLLTDGLFELSHGYLKKGNTHFYVSSGLSLWGPPFRIGTNSEMVVFNITVQ